MTKQNPNLRQVASHDRKYILGLKLRIYKILGDKCNNPNCLVIGGCKDIRCLQIDHINGGGHQERIKFPSRKMFYLYVFRQLQAGSKDYQLLCANCNWIKRFEKHEFNKIK